jgi:transketolase
MSTGSLGQGLSAGIGMAIGRDMREMDFHVFVLLGDGEIQEGQVWEAAMYAGFHKIRKLIAIVDYNKLQLSAPTHEILNMEPLVDKWQAFGWNVLSCDGHDVEELVNVVDEAKAFAQCPTVIIANTHKGHGVSFIENRVEWHAKAPTEEELERALVELGCAQ